MTLDGQDAATDEGASDSRYLIAIRSWEWHLHVGLSPASTPPEYRFQGGLLYTRALEIHGEVVAPAKVRRKAIRIWISPFGPELVFGPDAFPEVGRLYFRHPETKQDGLSASLHLPENALATTATCLASIWKYLHLWTFDPDIEQASVSDYSFSADIHERLQAWANGA